MPRIVFVRDGQSEPSAPTEPPEIPDPSLGRYSKFEPEVAAKLLNALRIGCPIPAACAEAGVRVGTLNDWLRKAKTLKRGPTVQFAKDYAAAQEYAEALHVKNIARAATKDAPGDWKASAFILSRRFASRWSEKRTVELAVREKASQEVYEDLLQVAEQVLDREAYRALVTALEERVNPPAEAAGESEPEAAVLEPH